MRAKEQSVGRHAGTSIGGRVTRINTRTAATWYVLVMAAWVYGFAAVDRELPPLLVFSLLLLAGAAQVAVGFALGRWEALGLAAVPIVLAVAAPGAGTGLAVSVGILMVFPGAPFIALGVHLRQWKAERDDGSPDAWLYGERPE